MGGAELELLGIGQQKGTTILLKKGNCLKEYPYYYTEEFSKPFICKFTLYSDLPGNLALDDGLAKEIMALGEESLVQTIKERGTKRPKSGELLFVPEILTHWESLIFVIIHQLENPNDDDRIEIVEYLKLGLDLAEEKQYDAVVMPGHSMIYKMYPLDEAVRIHFDAIGMFLENRTTNFIKIISLCIEQEDQIEAFLLCAQERFQQYSAWLF